MQIWEEEGIARHGFAPVYTYPGVANRPLHNTLFIRDHLDDRTYYLSFPSLSYVLPYVAFRVVGAPIAPLSLQIFNIVAHAGVLWLLFHALLLLTDARRALLGVCMYAFAPALLWFHGNGYTHHVLAQLGVIAVGYTYLRALRAEHRWWEVSLSVCLLLLLLTEWIGVFLGVVLGIATLVRWRSQPSKSRGVMAALLTSSVIAVATLIVQYEYYFGLQTYVDYQLGRFAERSTLVNDTHSTLYQAYAWLKWTATGYGVWMILVVAVVARYIYRTYRQLAALSLSYDQVEWLLLTGTPALLYHLVFMEFTVVHDYSVLIDGFLWVSVLAIGAQVWQRNFQWYILVAIVMLAVAQYYYINRPGTISRSGDPYDMYANIGRYIQEQVEPNQVLFIAGFSERIPSNNPQITFYAERNFIAVGDYREAVQRWTTADSVDAYFLQLERIQVDSTRSGVLK